MKKWEKTAICWLTVSLLAMSMSACSAGKLPEPPDQGAQGSDSDKKPEGASSGAGNNTDDASSGGKWGSAQAGPFTPAGIPEASGTAVEENESALIDYSNMTDGYVMVDFSGDTGNQLKVQVEGPATTYTYDLKAGKWTTFPLSDGDGSYKVTVYEGMGNGKYSTVLSASLQVTLNSEFAPFLHANQYVDYSDAVNTMAKTAELTSGTADTLEKVGNIYDYVI